MCDSYNEFSLTFYRRNDPDSLIPYLLAGTEDEKGLCHDFLTEVVSRFEEDDTVKPMIVNAVAGMSSQLAFLSMNGNYTKYVEVRCGISYYNTRSNNLQAFKMLLSFPPIVTAIAQSPHFQLALSAPSIEKNTILGPYFRLSPLQPEVTKAFFPTPRNMEKTTITTSQSAMRMSLQTHQKDLMYIVNAFIKGGEVSRGRMLDWFAYVVNQNHKRRAMRVDERAVSSDGFMMNVTVVLDVLCEPFMDASFSKVDRIDVEYLRRKPRIDIKEETKLNADQNASDAFYDTEIGGKSNFISEVFFLTLAAHHYGSEAMNAKLKGLDRDIKHFEKTIAQMEAERPKMANV